VTIYGDVEVITQAGSCPGVADQTVFYGQFTNGQICGS
jgi:hypothetical protein